MKRTLLSLFFISTIVFVKAQQNVDLSYIADSITADANLLYRSEMASWYGTDIFMVQSNDKTKAKGYFSYVLPSAARCIFFTGDEVPKVIGSITFDSTYNVSTAITDFTERYFTEVEKEIFDFRKKSLEIINSDTFFLQYQNTNYNIIPLIVNNEKRLYILTGTTQRGEVIFGNDYLLYFDAENKLINKKKLHNSIIRTNFGKQEDGQEIVGGMHSHVIDDFITATDICTLMMYNSLMKWKQYTVVSKRYFSQWNCETNQLVILTNEAIQKINSHQQKKRKKQKD